MTLGRWFPARQPPRRDPDVHVHQAILNDGVLPARIECRAPRSVEVVAKGRGIPVGCIDGVAAVSRDVAEAAVQIAPPDDGLLSYVHGRVIELRLVDIGTASTDCER